MKKIFSALIISLLLIPLAHAATFYSDNDNTLALYQTRDLSNITIAAESDGEITAQHGINLTFDLEKQVLWDAVETLTATGSAVDNGKVASTVTPEYLNGYRVLHIPVLADFAAGESVTLSGNRLRAYKKAFRETFFWLDVNGDLLADFYDVNKLEVENIQATDHTPPYPPTEFTAVLSDDLKSISLSWVRTPDFDFIGTYLDRVRVRDGQTQDINVLNRTILTEYTDTDIQEGDIITYKVYGSDERNFSEFVEITIEVTETPPEPDEPVIPEDPVVPPPPPPADGDEDEIDELNRLYGYYKVRHEIRCIGPNSSPESSLCLWAKIDLIYTQQLTGQSDVSASLTDRDLYLMALRVKWPESRYQTKCVEADVPDKTCEALGKSLKRIHYFID